LVFNIPVVPITKSAKKALRASKKKAAVNKPVRTRVKMAIAKVRKSPSETALRKVYSVLDKAAKKKVIKKGKADRLKSRLTKFVNQSLGTKKTSKKPTKKAKTPKKKRTPKKKTKKSSKKS